MDTFISENLYDELMTLCDTDHGFYHVDQSFQNRVYRVFSYRLVSYTMFHELPSALNCRGTTFDVTDLNDIVLVSLPPHKFFNLREGARDETIDYENEVESIMAKEDGSLISTVVRMDGTLILKSKTSFESVQATDATEWLHSESNFDFLAAICWLCYNLECTVNMEWVSPNNQIVLPYKKAKLVILNVRFHDGSYLDIKSLDHFNEIESFVVDTFVLDPTHNKKFIENVEHMCPNDDDKLIEGYVVNLVGGDKIKVKTSRYVRLHHTKDNIANDRRLFEVVIRQEHDDLLAMLAADPISVDRINQMEAFVITWYNEWLNDVETYHTSFKHYDRKDFAIAGQECLTKLQFSYAMVLYQDKEFDVLTLICKNADEILKENNYEYIPNYG